VFSCGVSLSILFKCFIILCLQGNWIFKTDAQLLEQKPEYDVVLLLSTTKWIHLNWGDEGLKRAFRRIFCALKPGGIFILEPQEYKSYLKKKKLTVGS
jgi:7SK snRNA methylphosphate capping enzyme